MRVTPIISIFIILITILQCWSCSSNIARHISKSKGPLNLIPSPILSNVAPSLESFAIEESPSDSLKRSFEGEGAHLFLLKPNNGGRLFSVSLDLISHNDHSLLPNDNYADLRFRISIPQDVQDKYHMILVTPELLLGSKSAPALSLDHIALSGDIYAFVRNRQHYFADVYRDRYRIRNLLSEEMEGVIVNKTITTQYGNSKILDTTITPNQDIIYTYSHLLSVSDSLSRAFITLKGVVLGLDQSEHALVSNDTIEYHISHLGGLIDYTPRYHKRVKDKTIILTNQYRIVFDNDRSRIDPRLEDNASELNKIDTFIDSLLLGGIYSLESIEITASASPIGKINYNRNLSRMRSESLYRHLRKRIGRQNAGKLIAVTSTGENWKDLITLIQESAFPNKEAILSVIDYYFKNNKDIDGLEWLELRKFPEYTTIRDQMYPHLRRVFFTYNLRQTEPTDIILEDGPLDESYETAVKLLADREYGLAHDILKNYSDQNYAICLLGLNKNKEAYSILQQLPRSSQVETLLRIVNTRLRNIKEIENIKK